MSRPPNLASLDSTSPKYERLLAPLTVEQSETKAPEAVPEMGFKLVCHMVANGESIEIVHKKTGIPVEFIEDILSTPRGQDTVVRMQAEMTLDPQQRLKKLATLAVDVQTRLLLNKNTSPTILAALTRDILDRAHGKAIQITENRNLNFELKDAAALDRALLAQEAKVQKIEEMQKKLAVATSAETIVFERPKNAMDRLNIIKRS